MGFSLNLLVGMFNSNRLIAYAAFLCLLFINLNFISLATANTPSNTPSLQTKIAIKEAVITRTISSKTRSSETTDQNQLSLTADEQEWIKQNPTVIYAAEKDWAPYDFVDSKGNHIGISRSLLERISDLTGIKFIPDVDSWENLLQKTKQGKIVLMPVLLYTPTRSHIFTYSERYGANTPYFFTNQIDAFKDGNDLKNKTVAIPKSYGYIETIKRLYPKLTVLEFDTLKLAINSVLEGKADLLVDSHASAKYMLNSLGIGSIKAFTPVSDNSLDSIYMATLKENSLLIDIINKSLNTISQDEKQKILNYWLSFTSTQELDKRIALSPSEIAWMNFNHKVRLSGHPNWIPFETFDKNGHYAGITADYLKIIEDKLGIEFDIIRTGSWQETLKRFKAGQLDIIPESLTSTLARNYPSSQSYLETPIVILMRENDRYASSLKQLKNKKVALLKDYSYANIIKGHHSELDLVMFNSTQEAVDALASGEVEAFICSSLNATYQINQMDIGNLHIVGKTPYKISLGFIASNKMEPLIPLINKVIDSIDIKEHNKILNHWRKQNEAQVIDYDLAWKVIAGLFLVSLLIWTWIYLLQKEIRKRKISENDLKDMNNRFTLAAEAASIGFWQFNVPKDTAAEPTLIADETTLQLYGFTSSDEPNWLDIASRMHEEDRDKVRQFKLAAIKQNSKKPLKEQFRVHKPDGSIRHLYSAVINDSVDPEENLSRLIGISWDITDLKESQEAAEQAKAQADDANKAKSEFLSNMSHEIRTPMNAILGFTELLDDSIEDTRSKSFINTIKSAGNSLLAIINDILDLSKIEAGKMEITKSPSDIHNLLEEVSHIFLIKAQEKNLDIILEIDPNMPRFVWIDETRLRQILFNLIGNAVKFTETGYIRIRIEKTGSSSHVSLVNFVIHIEDTGIGISDKDKIKIFQSFQQVSGQDTRKYGGTGLGLSISLRLAELMSGEITLNSHEGAGSTFSLYLPDTKLCINLSKPAISEQSKLDKLQFAPSKVLVVDDVENNRLLITSNLEHKGFSIKTAKNGLEALKLAQAEAFDIILMDIRMPVMDGYEAAAKIREFSDTPIIAFTASISITQKSAEEHPHFSSFLRKPVLRHQLYNEIARYIAHTNTEQENPSNQFESISKNDIFTIQEPSKLELISLASSIKEFLGLKQQAQVLQQTNNIQATKAFSRELDQLLQQTPIKSLELVHKELQQDLNSFDIAGIKTGLANFSQVVEQLETILESKTKAKTEK